MLGCGPPLANQHALSAAKELHDLQKIEVSDDDSYTNYSDYSSDNESNKDNTELKDEKDIILDVYSSTKIYGESFYRENNFFFQIIEKK